MKSCITKQATSIQDLQDDGSDFVRSLFGGLDVKGSIAHIFLVCISESGIAYSAGLGQMHVYVWGAASAERKRSHLG